MPAIALPRRVVDPRSPNAKPTASWAKTQSRFDFKSPRFSEGGAERENFASSSAALAIRFHHCYIGTREAVSRVRSHNIPGALSIL